MPPFSEVEYALDQSIEPRAFENLCVDLLIREGYRSIVPGGGKRDHGRDAECRFWVGDKGVTVPLAFQFSLEDTWERKLRRDIPTIAKHCPTAKGIVFVTSQSASVEKQDKLCAEIRSEYGWDISIYDRGWLRSRLEELHQDLASKYLSVSPPDTVCHAETLIDIHGLTDESAKNIFRNSSPEAVKATIIARTKKHPEDPKAWKALAHVEYHLHNFETALKAAARAQSISPNDVNIRMLRAAIVAEQGIRSRSRVLLVQAKEIFQWAVNTLERGIDHYNLANVLGALGEIESAEIHYRKCIEIEPECAQAWKNLGSLLFKKGDHTGEMECFNRAIELRPDLVEAYVCKANTLLIVFDDSEEAIRCYETAYGLAPDLDSRWSHARYWYAAAMFAANRPLDALEQVEFGLAMMPDNPYLLNLKASLLSHLWREDEHYESNALAFFKFRATVLRRDYPGLDELIQLLERCGRVDETWPFIDANIEAGPLSMQKITSRANIGIDRLRAGFSVASAYRQFRECSRIRDYFVAMYEYGLSPDDTMECVLYHVLMAPFEIVNSQMPSAVQAGKPKRIKAVFEDSLSEIARIFPAFGAYWLAPVRPETRERQVNLLSLGLCYLPDIIVMEASRQYGFALGVLGVPTGEISDLGGRDWKDLYADVGSRLLESVAEDWGLFGSGR